MKYSRVAGLDIPVSCLGLGGEQLGGYGWRHLSEGELVKAVAQGVDKGITLFDTAPIYGLGRSEELLGKILGRHRKNVLIATKVGLVWEKAPTFQKSADSSPANIMRELGASLKRLNTDYIDLYQIHWPDPATPMEDTMMTLEKLKKEGKVRAVGVCNFSLDLLKEAGTYTEIASLQMPYNLIDRAIEKDILPFCREKGIAVIAYTPLAKGLLSGKYDRSTKFGAEDNRSHHHYFEKKALEKNLEVAERVKVVAQRLNCTPTQIALRWVLQNPSITTVLVGVRDAAQLEDNVGAADISLSPEDLEFLNGKGASVAF